MYFLKSKTMFKPDITFPLSTWTLFTAGKMSSTQPELTGLRPQIPVSMQQETMVISRQQKALDVTTTMPVVLTAEDVIKNLPVSMAVSISSDIKSLQTVNVGMSTMSTDVSTVSTTVSPTGDLIVVSNVGPLMSPEQAQTQAQTPSQSQTPQIQTQTPAAVTYNLSELVMKEKESLFRLEDNSSVFILEPPRMETQTVRMRSKNFFTVMEEEEEEGEKQLTVAESTTTETSPKLQANIPLYTPVFNFGQSLHKIFNHQHKRRAKQGKAVVKAEDQTDKPAEQATEQTQPPRPSSCGYESDPEHFVQLYEKITINPGRLRRNASQPNIDNYSGEEFSQLEGSTTHMSSQSQSMPTTPRVSPRLRRRNSASSTDMVRPGAIKPEASGPGLSFLASVAGELRNQKKRYPDPQTQIAKTNSDIKAKEPVTTVTTAIPINEDSRNLQVVEANPQKGAIDKSKPIRGRIFKKADTLSGYDSSPGTSPTPKRNAALAEMKAGTMAMEGNGGKKSFIKSITDWSVTSQTKVSNKEANVWSPTSF